MSKRLTLKQRIQVIFWTRHARSNFRVLYPHVDPKIRFPLKFDRENYIFLFDRFKKIPEQKTSYLDFLLSRCQTESALAWQFGLRFHPWNKPKEECQTEETLKALVVSEGIKCPLFVDPTLECDPNCARLAFCNISRNKAYERMKVLRYPRNEQVEYVRQRWDDLEPCPCCGGKADCNEYVETSPDGFCPTVGYFFCTQCGLRTEMYIFHDEGDKEKQFYNWNRRIIKNDLPDL